jgi:hypothetical protein
MKFGLWSLLIVISLLATYFAIVRSATHDQRGPGLFAIAIFSAIMFYWVRRGLLDDG